MYEMVMDDQSSQVLSSLCHAEMQLSFLVQPPTRCRSRRPRGQRLYRKSRAATREACQSFQTAGGAPTEPDRQIPRAGLLVWCTRCKGNPADWVTMFHSGSDDHVCFCRFGVFMGLQKAHFTHVDADSVTNNPSTSRAAVAAHSEESFPPEECHCGECNGWRWCFVSRRPECLGCSDFTWIQLWLQQPQHAVHHWWGGSQHWDWWAWAGWKWCLGKKWWGLWKTPCYLNLFNARFLYVFVCSETVPISLGRVLDWGGLLPEPLRSVAQNGWAKHPCGADSRRWFRFPSQFQGKTGWVSLWSSRLGLESHAP